MKRRRLWRLVSINVLLAATALFFGYQLAREMSGPRPLPPPPVPRAAPAEGEAAGGGATPVPSDPRVANVIASRNLFSPTRSETVAEAAPPASPPAPKPLLMGVVLGVSGSRAYLEDPLSKRVFGYAEGDSVGGGRIESIKEDRVVITRPEGTIEVMLRDPSKPRPPAAPAAGVPGAPAPAVRPGVQPQPPAVRPIPAQPAPAVRVPGAPPRPLQSIPPDFLRRRGAAPTPAPDQNKD